MKYSRFDLSWSMFLNKLAYYVKTLLRLPGVNGVAPNIISYLPKSIGDNEPLTEP